jgi:hypothetical protein
MPNYTVTLYETIYHTVDVEADSADKAVALAMNTVTGDVGDYETESQGINSWSWEIEEA